MLRATSYVLQFMQQWAADDYKRVHYLPVLADALEEAGYSYGAILHRLRTCQVEYGDGPQVVNAFVCDELQYDWGNVFAYAGEEVLYGYGEASISAAPPTKAIDTSPFTRMHVETVFGTSAGANDGPNWLVYGKLLDGRYFFITAGCDYTGWG